VKGEGFRGFAVYLSRSKYTPDGPEGPPHRSYHARVMTVTAPTTYASKPLERCSLADPVGQCTVVIIALLLLLSQTAEVFAADWKSEVSRLAGKDGVVLAVDEKGEVLVDVDSQRSFIPASILKIPTSLLAANYLGMDYRFSTEFFFHDGLLIVRGQGDPMLVSEELDVVAKTLAPLLGGQVVSGVGIDDSYFEDAIKIPGVGGSDNPYDALNSATAVNFNTINVVVEGDEVRSAEAQTPLTPLAKKVALRRGVQGKVRVNLSSSADDVRRYAAELIAAKLREAGVAVGTRYEQVVVADSKPLYVHQSSKTVADACAGLLHYSNNYIANQVFLAVGAAHAGAPASLNKSVAAAREFIAGREALSGLVMTEGSGISYENRTTAQAMIGALGLFLPHRKLLRVRQNSDSKTGTLSVTRSVAGYIDTKNHGTVRYVISLDKNGSWRRWKIVEAMQKAL
jgi:serine-type D-Ala-D-Ala carboxypeptidase/endopeptidase (penicillin-binding protein 4)